MLPGHFVCYFCRHPFDAPYKHLCQPECRERPGTHLDFCPRCQFNALFGWRLMNAREEPDDRGDD